MSETIVRDDTEQRHEIDNLDAQQTLAAELRTEVDSRRSEPAPSNFAEADVPAQDDHVAAAREAVEVAADAAGERKTGQTIAERHPGWPPVELRFHFGYHANAEDLDGLGAELRDGVDIYFYENSSGDDGTRQALQDIADASPEDDNAKLNDNSPFWDKMADSLRGTHALVSSFDLTRADAAMNAEIWDGLNGAPWLGNPDFEATLDTYTAHKMHGVELQEQREEIMAERYEARLEQIIEAYPELLEKDKIVSLATLGAFHTGLYQDLARRGESVSRTFSRNFRSRFTPEEELTRAYRFKREPSRELVARAYLEDMLGCLDLATEIEDGHQTLFNHKPGEPINMADYAIYVRKLTDQLSMDDIAEPHPRLAQLTDESKPRQRKRILKAVLAKTNMGALPKSAKELHERAEQLQLAA